MNKTCQFVYIRALADKLIRLIRTKRLVMLEKDEKITTETEAQAHDTTVDDNMSETEEATVENNEDQEVSSTESELKELKEKYLRLFAEFDNYKKRTIKEKLELMRTAAQDTMSALLPVLDDFDRAKKSAEDDQTNEVFSEGVELVYHKLYAVLQSQGLVPMESTGEPFNPDIHEAITDIPAPTEDMKGTVIDTIERGYKLKDKIIRHAKVVVGN